ncbi:HEAT repeat domain-containing protein [Embleya sp. NPDC050493]|uniref:HEAT repeat domain-containing protein n=1 Tax=Embleya sp. NPDC050493 TaxID=3363989 RepID=UPI00379E3A16
MSKTREIAARIAAELDPDRDPDPIIDVLRPFYEDMARGMARFRFPKRYRPPFVSPTNPLYMIGLGVARLRRLSPVSHYAGMLASDEPRQRHFACSALGDTADPDALPFLQGALHDPHHRVRTNAADALRRLHNTGVTWNGGSIDTTLRHGLADDHHHPALACAHTLIVVGRRDTVRAALPDLRRSRQRRLASVLAGDVPRLSRLWPEDATT